MSDRLLTDPPRRQKLSTTATNKDTFEATLRKLQCGDRIVYHTGDLMADRGEINNASTGRIRAVARAAWRAYEAGLVTLVQKRLGYGEFEYTAVKL